MITVDWEVIILKESFEDIDSFIKQMKRITVSAINSFKKFNTETKGAFDSVELGQLGNAISDMGDAIMDLEKMRDRQEELQ